MYPLFEKVVKFICTNSKKLVRGLLYSAPLYLIVITLLIIALPKNVTNSLAERILGPRIENVELKTVLNEIVSNGQKESAPTHIQATKVDKGESVVEVAKLALDGSKDKYDTIKEMYDRLFSIIVAMAALIAFLGFKGVESFIEAKRKTDDTVQRAENAQQKADQSLSEVQDFIINRYPADNRAEINVFTGMLHMHISDAYENILKLCKPDYDLSKNKEYLRMLFKGLSHLETAVKRSSKKENGADELLLKQAIITQGNIYRRLGDFQRAIFNLEKLEEVYGIVDSVAIYNIACYSCKLGSKYSEEGSKATEVADCVARSLKSLEKAISLEPENQQFAKDDEDFQWFRSTKNEQFLALTNSAKSS